MKRRKGMPALAGILFPAVVAVVVLCFMTGLSNLTEGRTEEDKAQLEQALRRSAVACYAAEGIYPPDLAYLKEHYGLQIDEEKYTVIYEVFASNLMPDITILENET